MTKLTTLALAMLALATSAASAKSVGSALVKQARKTDVASEYQLKSNGALFRKIGNQLCQVTNHVDDFKIAQHPNDPTLAYIVRDGALEALTLLADATEATQCPKAELSTLVAKLDRTDGGWVYKVIDRADTPLSLIAQDANGTVTAWDDRGVAVTVNGVVETEMNTCFGAKKKSFSSYVAFSIDADGLVSKIGGKDPRKSKADTKRYANLDAFLAQNRVCQ
jgi:hypothetical protein